MKLFLDDIRNPTEPDFIVARSSDMAIKICKVEWPDFMSLDHDLGEGDTTMVFLYRLVNEVWDKKSNPPDYFVHSANPVGKNNIISFIESWKKSMDL